MVSGFLAVGYGNPAGNSEKHSHTHAWAVSFVSLAALLHTCKRPSFALTDTKREERAVRSEHAQFGEVSSSATAVEMDYVMDAFVFIVYQGDKRAEKNLKNVGVHMAPTLTLN